MSIRVSEVLYIVIGFSIMLINTSESSNSSLGDPTVTPTVTIRHDLKPSMVTVVTA